VTRRLSSLHARAICHATEDSSKVELAIRAVVGDAEVRRSVTEGHFGNTIEVLESSIDEERAIMDVFGHMTADDISKVASTIEARIDDSCHFFLRFDKQEAFMGRLRLSDGDDVVAVRVKVRAFPAKPAVAAQAMTAVLEDVSSRSPGQADRSD